MHGRVAMLAAAGFLVQERFHPLFDGAIEGAAIYHIPQIPPLFWAILGCSIAVAESSRAQIAFVNPSGDINKAFLIRDDYEPGDIGFDPLGLKPEDEDELITMQCKELNNGRLAMIAAAGFLAQESVSHQPLFS
jgi:light-harvesting complex I chlorophyll a/b binding protein 1